MPKKKQAAAKSARKLPQRKTAFDRNVTHFKEEVEALGKRAEYKECECCGETRGGLGLLGPLVSAMLGLLGVILVIVVMDYAAQRTGMAIMSFGVREFLLSNMGLFFLIFLISAYTTYFSRARPTMYLALSPLSVAFGITVFLWIISSIIIIEGARIWFPGFDIVAQYALYARNHLPGIFWFFSFVGYLFLFVRLLAGNAKECAACASAKREPSKKVQVPDDGIKRLYRSGKDKILGGVCGGIAEYLGVDPVLIRFIWAIAVFFFGTGVLLYIIAWIIIPRNPNHSWD